MPPTWPRNCQGRGGARLRAKGEAALAARFSAMTGKIRSVLVEKPGFGHSECFAPVAFDGHGCAGHDRAGVCSPAPMEQGF